MSNYAQVHREHDVQRALRDIQGEVVLAVVALVDDTLPIADIRNEPSPAENEVSSSPAANSSLAHPSIL